MAFNKKAGGSCRLNFKRKEPMRTTKGRSPPIELNSENGTAFRNSRTALFGQIIQIIISKNLKNRNHENFSNWKRKKQRSS
jgi:hypothetical protein